MVLRRLPVLVWLAASAFVGGYLDFFFGLIGLRGGFFNVRLGGQIGLSRSFRIGFGYS